MRHVSQWNILLVASANAIDVSFLRVSQPGDPPIWTQEFPNDLYPAELPLSTSTDETFPLGFELDTASSGRLLQEDGSPYPVMPMIHILSTAGVLCSFYVLNTTQGTVDICSPARPIEASAMNFFKKEQQEVVKTPPKSFVPPIGQSTPAPVQQPAPSFMQQPPPPFTAFQTPLMSQPPPQVTQQTAQQPVKPVQALITVPPTFTPPVKKSEPQIATVATEKPSNTAEDELIYSKMIQDEMKAFELELKSVMEKSRSLKVNIGTKEESAEMRRGIEELDELRKEATETIESLRGDVQSNRLGLTETFAMVYEAKGKLSEKSMLMSQNQSQVRIS